MSTFRPRIEVTVAVAFVDDAGEVLNSDMADATLAFERPGPTLLPGATEAEDQAAISRILSQLLAFLQVGLTAAGMRCLGSVDEPMTGDGTTVRIGQTEPVAVRVIGGLEVRGPIQ